MPDAFREALSYWASGVTVVSVREADGTVHATTVTSFASVSATPPRILVSLGPGAQVLPFLEEGARFAVNFLSRHQKALAIRYADAYPVGPSPFPERGDPVVEGALVALVATAVRVIPVNGTRIVIGAVAETLEGDAPGPLLRYRREYHGLAPPP
jgi:flavin reductase (DIM6/NTAB) family NADH-FMN oxidoreductase RutF